MNYDQKSFHIIQKPTEVRALTRRGYYIQQQLGEGGYAKVYRTDYISPQNRQKFKLACKLIDTSVAPANYVTKFLPKELKIISKLSHPHIIAVHSILQMDTKYFIFMRLAEQGDLLDYIIRYGPISESLAKIWLRQISLAVQYLHLMEIAHRDLKCDNILITQHNNAKVTDFGFSRFVTPQNHKPIISETFCGSISYASPQILLGEPYDPKATDLWSIGCILYVMLNKSSPFDPNNLRTMLENQCNKKFRFRTKYISRYGKEVVTLVSCLLEPKEHLRYKVEQVLSSPWISMEPSLRRLNKYEFKSLSDALAAAKQANKNTSNEIITINNNNRRYSSIKYLKEYDAGFDLSLINSEINAQRRLSS